jgi:outer membrane protein TolC
LLSAQLAPVFPTPAYFRKTFQTPATRVELQPPVRLADFVVDGKLTLSLRAFLDLVMANNPDVQVQKLTVDTAQNNIIAAFRIFDPTLTVTTSRTYSATPSSDQLQGATVSKSLNWPLSFAYRQTLQNGTQFNVGLNGSYGTSNSSFTTYNPAENAALSFGFTQPLLRGRSAFINRLPITLARASLRSTQYNLTNAVESLVVTAEGAYWDVVGNRETLKVRQSALENAQASLDRSNRELELGALPQLDIYQPQANKASADIQVTQSAFRLAQSEDALRKQIGADLDPNIRNLPLLLTEAVAPPSNTSAFDKEGLVQQALASRSDLLAQRIGLETDDLTIRQNTDSLRPQLNWTGSYASNGRGGNLFQKTTLGGTNGTTMIPGGFGDATSQMFAFNYTTYVMGLTLTLPIRDRSGQAALANSLIRKKSDTFSMRSREQGVRLDVLNAISQVQSSQESVKLAIINQDLAQKMLDAENQKYDLGTSTMFLVLDAQTRLTAAQSTVVTESINYWRNQLNLLRVTGQLLPTRGITIQ